MIYCPSLHTPAWQTYLVDAWANRKTEVVRDASLPEFWALPPAPALVHNGPKTVTTRVVRVEDQPLDGSCLLVVRYPQDGMRQIVAWDKSVAVATA